MNRVLEPNLLRSRNPLEGIRNAVKDVNRVDSNYKDHSFVPENVSTEKQRLGVFRITSQIGSSEVICP